MNVFTGHTKNRHNNNKYYVIISICFVVAIKEPSLSHPSFIVTSICFYEGRTRS